MKKIYLHMGLPKTGTSYLQSTFAKNEHLYKKNGLIYPDLSNNHKRAIEGHTTTGNGLQIAQSVDPFLIDGRNVFDYVSFFSNLDSNYDYLISSEWFISISPEKIIEFSKLVKKTHQFHLIFFYRSIPELINSSYLQALKTGQVYGEIADEIDSRKNSIKNQINKLIRHCQSDIEYSVFNYNCCQDLVCVFDYLVFGGKVSIPFKSSIVNPSPDSHQIRILKLIADLGFSNLDLNMKYIEKSGGKSKSEFLINKGLAESIESDFKDEIKVLNEISFEGHQYLPFKNFKKSVVKLSSFNLSPEDINHIKTSIEKTPIHNFKDSILWMSQFLGADKNSLLPEDFDSINYLILNPDLIFNRANPHSHFLNFGKKEGRQYKNN